MKSNIVSDKGKPMVVISGIRREGRSLEITGQLMGAWPSKMYVSPVDFGRMILQALRPGVLLFVVLFPFLLIADLVKNRG
jgi:hypothetical protein